VAKQLEISHSFFLHAKPADIIAALTEEKHIKNWWTEDVKINSGRGVFEWKKHGWKVELDIGIPDSGRVIWQCVRSNMQNTQAWENSVMEFKLIPEGEQTLLQFKHLNYAESPCFEVCNAGWKFVLGTSLKDYLEA
jgi:hypothetical protein